MARSTKDQRLDGMGVKEQAGKYPAIEKQATHKLCGLNKKKRRQNWDRVEMEKRRLDRIWWMKQQPLHFISTSQDAAPYWCSMRLRKVPFVLRL